MSVTVLNTDAGLSGKTLVNAEDSQTITGAKSFNRSPSAPFAVNAASAKVDNLNADKVDGADVSVSNGNRILVSSGGSIAEASALTNGQLLIGSTGAAPAAAALTAGSGITVTNGAGTITVAATSPVSRLPCSADSGTDTSVGATNVATCAISGLTALDTLIIKHTVESVTQQTAGARIYNTTDTVTVTQLHAGAAVAAAAGSIGEVIIRARQGSTTAIAAACKSGTFANGSGDTSTVATFSTAWTGSWTLALRHDGVTAGGTFKWVWAVYKMAGQ